MMKTRFFWLSALVLILTSFIIQYGPHPAAAATFINHNLMDDVIFDRWNTFSNASAIDTFLNQFPNSCISSNKGFKAPEPIGYSPTGPSDTGGFSYGSDVTAGTIIYDAAKTYGLNPQVILTTLQKEQGYVIGPGTYSCASPTSPTARLGYTGAMGYACPDGGTTYNYGGFELYSINGTAVTSVTGTCVDSSHVAGFSRQVIVAAWQLKFNQQRSLGNTGWNIQLTDFPHSGNIWDNSDDPTSTYNGPMTSGTYARVDGGPTTPYDGYTTIDGSSVHMDTGATAALYYYTPHFAGNQSFENLFQNSISDGYLGFGSPYSHCIFPTDGSGGAYRLFQPSSGQTFLTTSPSEVCTVSGKMGYVWDGIAFYPSGTGNDPVYRLDNGGNFLYTAKQSEVTSAESHGWRLNGIAFDASKTQTASAPLPVYRLNYPKTGGYLYTASTEEANSEVAHGYIMEGAVFYTANNSGQTTNDIYRLASTSGGYLYTPYAEERDVAVDHYGYRLDGIGFQAFVGFSTGTTPVYRLASVHGYLYTTSLPERARAIKLGYRSEGIDFYAYAASDTSHTPVYRLSNHSSGIYFFTTSYSEAQNAVAKYGYTLEGIGFRVP